MNNKLVGVTVPTTAAAELQLMLELQTIRDKASQDVTLNDPLAAPPQLIAYL